MFGFLSKGNDKANKLKEENESLKKSLEECSKKLQDKQEQINKTNAYYKKKMYNLLKK